MILTKGTKFNAGLIVRGASCYLLVAQEMLEYLGIGREKPELLTILADESKHGKFIAMFKAGNKPKERK
jgi:hypothetical protein